MSPTTGVRAGATRHSWKPVAELQRDLYLAVKSDPQLAKYPVWSISEPGAQIDNVGLQFLTIPPGAPTLMPEGTTYADYANVHNYIYHPHSPGLANNKSWDATDPTAASRVDGLFGNFGQTWLRGFRGYSQEELDTLPRVTTETGAAIGGHVTEEIQALNLMNLTWRNSAAATPTRRSTCCVTERMRAAPRPLASSPRTTRHDLPRLTCTT